MTADSVNFSLQDANNFTINGESLGSKEFKPVVAKPNYYMMTPMSGSTSTSMKLDFSNFDNFESLSVDDIYPFITYSVGNGNASNAGMLSYAYDNTSGILTVSSGSGWAMATSVVVPVIVNPKAVYELPLVYVSATECYIDLTSIPNYKMLRTGDMLIRLSSICRLYSGGSPAGQSLYYDYSIGRLYYYSPGSMFSNYSRTVLVAVAQDTPQEYVSSKLEFPDGTGFYLDEKDGTKGFNTDPERGADTFFPFKSFIGDGFELIHITTNRATTDSADRQTYTFNIPENSGQKYIIFTSGDHGNSNGSQVAQTITDISNGDISNIKNIATVPNVNLWSFSKLDSSLASTISVKIARTSAAITVLVFKVNDIKSIEEVTCAATTTMNSGVDYGTSINLTKFGKSYFLLTSCSHGNTYMGSLMHYLIHEYASIELYYQTGNNAYVICLWHIVMKQENTEPIIAKAGRTNAGLTVQSIVLS